MKKNLLNHTQIITHLHYRTLIISPPPCMDNVSCLGRLLEQLNIRSLIRHKKKCLIGVTRPTLVTLLTLDIFINFSTIFSSFSSHYACEILRAIDVACKSYKRKRSDSSVTTIFTIHEFSQRFRF